MAARIYQSLSSQWQSNDNVIIIVNTVGRGLAQGEQLTSRKRDYVDKVLSIALGQG